MYLMHDKLTKLSEDMSLPDDKRVKAKSLSNKVKMIIDDESGGMKDFYKHVIVEANELLEVSDIKKLKEVLKASMELSIFLVSISPLSDHAKEECKNRALNINNLIGE